MMYEFLDRLLNVDVPRIKDFRGLSPDSFDTPSRNGTSYSFGLTEQAIFPEIDFDKIVKTHGMDITINTTARTKEEAYELLKLLGVPFRKAHEITGGIVKECIAKKKYLSFYLKG